MSYSALTSTQNWLQAARHSREVVVVAEEILMILNQFENGDKVVEP
jgi:hypothetical protein